MDNQKDPVEELKIVIISELKKLLDPVIEKLTYFIGKFSKTVRKEYYDASGKYMWGIIRFLRDDFIPECEKQMQKEDHSDMIDAFLYSIIKNNIKKQKDFEKFIKDSLTRRI